MQRHQQQYRPQRPDLQPTGTTENMADGTIDLTGEEPVVLTKEEKIEQEVIDLTEQDDLIVQTPEAESTENPIPEGHIALDFHTIGDDTFIPGGGVELANGEFFWIKFIIQETCSRKVQLKGYRLSRTNQLCRVTTRGSESRDYFPKKQKVLGMYNELCVLAPTLHCLDRPGLDQNLVTAELEDVICHREIRFTNAQFPKFSHFEDPFWAGKKNGDAKYSAPLVVRWKHGVSMNKSGKSDIEGAIDRLTEDEAEVQYRIPDVRLQQDFLPSAAAIDLTKEHGLADSRSTKQNYHSLEAQKQPPERKKHTCADICAGAGGSLSGAIRAGFKPIFAVDKWSVACETLRMNDKDDMEILEMKIAEVLDSPFQGSEYVDVLHISFPCPTWSPAKTRPAAADDDNSACIFATTALLLKFRPRIATFEQTFGLVTHYPTFFQSFISNIVQAHYSVRWRIIDLAEYGLASHRHRLEVIAACPGEPLPTFPPPTHGLGPGKLPFSTIGSVLREANAAKAPDGMDRRGCRPRNDRPYNANTTMLKTYTCSGILQSHPSGKKSFTLFDGQLLAGFSKDHRFAGTDTDVKRQQGNAEPSVFTETLYKQFRKSLRATDRRNAAYRPPMVDLTGDDN